MLIFNLLVRRSQSFTAGHILIILPQNRRLVKTVKIWHKYLYE